MKPQFGLCHDDHSLALVCLDASRWMALGMSGSRGRPRFCRKRVAASCKGQRVSGGVGGGSGVGNTELDSADCKKT